MVDETHRADLHSWVEAANDPACEFPIQNLPLGAFVRDGASRPEVGAAIGDAILSLESVLRLGLVEGEARRGVEACADGTLNGLMALGPSARRALRRQLVALLRSDTPASDRGRAAAREILVPNGDARLVVPAAVGDYTDFYASIHHATNVGTMLRPDNPLFPNYKHVPIGYHGRASSIVASGTPVRRPRGQTKADGSAAPTFGHSSRLDYELEVGAYVGRGNALGEPIPVATAEDHLFGLCLVNDWSARDIQVWEYQPLGPFLAKSFATTVSPWVVTLDALEPFRAAAPPRPDGDPRPLPYLSAPDVDARGGFDIRLEVRLASERMRRDGAPPVTVSRGRFTDMYWTLGQLVAHHTSNGCNLRPGDLLASGTVSGPSRESRGCLLELTWRGTEPLQLPTGESRRFLEDGDEVIFRAYCEREGFARIGFGECRGVVLPAAE